MNSKTTYFILFIFSFTAHTLLSMHPKRLRRSLSHSHVKASRIDNTLLHKAVKRKNLTDVKNLLSSGVNVNAQDKLGNTSLHYAIQLNDILMIKELIWQGARLDVPNKDNITPWHLTSDDNVLHHGINLMYQNYTIHQLLEEQKYYLSEPYSVSYMKGGTPLHRAIPLQDSKILNQLIALGAHVNACDEFGNTPLHIAAYYSDKDPILSLLHAGANPYSLNVYGQTPEALAIQLGNAIFEEIKKTPSFISKFK